MAVAVTPIAKAAGFRPRSLDAVNFLLSDVRGALGPYLNVFLVTQQHWSQSEVGLVTTVSGLLGLSVQTPIGAAIDVTGSKRGAVILALAVLAVGASVIFALPRFWPVAMANTLVAIAGDVFPPAIGALTLGMYARGQLARRMGRNSAFDHAGNVAIAVIAGAVGPARLGMSCRNAPCFCSCRCSRCSLVPRCYRSRPPPSTTIGRAIWMERRTRLALPPDLASSSSPGH